MSLFVKEALEGMESAPGNEDIQGRCGVNAIDVSIEDVITKNQKLTREMARGTVAVMKSNKLNIISPIGVGVECDLTQHALEILRDLWKTEPTKSMMLTKYICSMDMMIKELTKMEIEKDNEIKFLKNRLMLIDTIDKEIIKNEIDHLEIANEERSKI